MNRHGSCSPRCPTSTSTGSWNPNVSTPSSSKRRVWPSCPRCFTAPHWRDSEPSWSAIQQLPPIVQSKQDYVHRATQTIAAHAPYPGSPVIVVDTAGSATCATQEGGFSRYNESTARLCAELAVQAVNDGIDSVAIIIPYVEQSRRIRRLLPSDQNLSGKIECRAVHRFQGGERDGHLRHGRCRSPATRHSARRQHHRCFLRQSHQHQSVAGPRQTRRHRRRRLLTPAPSGQVVVSCIAGGHPHRQVREGVLFSSSFKPLIGLQIPPGHIGEYPLHIVDQLDTVSRLVR